MRVGRMRVDQITSAVRAYDSKLYCRANEVGKLSVYRKSHRIETYDLGEGKVLHFIRPAPYFVFALTDNWKASGRPVDWGIEPILARLKAIDLWHRDLAEEIIQQEEKHAQSVARDRRNSIESFMYDFRDTFKKATNDINTATLEKKYRERKDEKRKKE